MNLDDLQKIVIKFRDERDWKQFHNTKDCAISLSLEAAELLEHFQWKNGQDITEHLAHHKEDVADEMSDIFYWLLLISHDNDIDLGKALISKMKKNVKKYPVDKAKGTKRKYTEL